jgi:hypothetical protein
MVDDSSLLASKEFAHIVEKVSTIVHKISGNKFDKLPNTDIILYWYIIVVLYYNNKRFQKYTSYD